MEQSANTNPFEQKAPEANLGPSVHFGEGAPSSIKKLFKPKVIFSALALVVIVELFLAYQSFNQPKDLQNKTALLGSQIKPYEIEDLVEGKIKLSAEKKEFKLNENVPVSILVSTGGHPTDGTDVILTYDRNILEASPAAVINGNTYQEFPIKDVDNQKGIIRISGLSVISKEEFSGLGILATINFKAKKVGTASVKVSFIKDETADSNIIESRYARDILSSVEGVDLVISDKGTAAAVGSCSPRVYQKCLDGKGRSGSYWCSSIADATTCNLGCYKSESSQETGCNVITTN
jgi:hypothetical protein